MSERHAAGPTIAIVGGGSIGVAFALTFARASYSVNVVEPTAQRRAVISDELIAKLSPLAEHGLLTEPVSAIVDRVRVTDSLEEAVGSAVLVQECVPEDAETKRSLFTRLASLVSPDAVVASSTSFIPASESARGSGLEEQVLVAHPGNPPFLIPVIELVPSPSTRPAILKRAGTLFRNAGLHPVMVHREVQGFVFNRIQGAVLREAYALVRDGVASVEDIDTVVKEGLGRRWAFMGPFETVDLNTRGGIAAHAERMGPFYEAMGAERGQHDPWTPELVEKIQTQRRAALPLQDWESRVAWRDAELIRRLAALENTSLTKDRS